MAGRTSADDDVRHQLLDFIPKEREWLMNTEGSRNHNSSDERKLELRLGPPGEYWNTKDLIRETNQSLSLGYFSSVALEGQHNPQQEKVSSFLKSSSMTQSSAVMAMEVPQPRISKAADMSNGEKKAFLPSSANTAVPYSSQKRTAPGPVVGWPPIRSFRKNIASTNGSKPSSDRECQQVVSDKTSGKNPVDCSSSSKGMFVKINMDGIPIGRKVDLFAYDSYEKLSSAVDELFRGLLAAQRDSSAGGIQNKEESEEAITGLLDGNGEYTLVYEDNEGDRVLVGDVPWNMFVSTVKRLRVLKSSELPSLSLGNKQR